MRTLCLMLLVLAVPGADAATRRPRHPHHPGAAVGLVRRGATGGKPDAPLRINAVPGRVLPDGSQVVRIVVTPLADAARVRVAIGVDRGLALAAGRPAWEGPARRGQAITEDVLLRSAYRGERRLVVTGTLVTGGENGEQSGVAVFSVGPRQNTPLGVAHPGSRVTRDRNGRRILEIPAAEF